MLDPIAQATPWSVLLDHFPCGVVIVDGSHRICQLNPEAARLLGDEPDGLIGSLFPWPFVPGESTEHDLPGTDGPHRIEVSAARPAHGTPPYQVLLLRDSTGLHARIERLELANDRFKALIRATPLPMLSVDRALEITFWSRAAEREFGWREEDVLGRPLQSLGDGVGSGLGELLAASLEGEPHEGVALSGWHDRHGQPLDLKVWSVPLKHRNGRIRGALAITMNTTHERHNREHLHHLVTHDPLTDLPNRTLFHDRLQQLLLRAPANGPPRIAVLRFALDRFKVVNASFGHAVGDVLLCEVAQRLRDTLYSSDTLARTGGDEFTILVGQLTRSQDCAAIAARLLQTLAHPFRADGSEIFLSASIGIAVWPYDGPDADHLLTHADSALRLAKEQGGNSWQFHTHELHDRARARLELESDLRRALDRGELHLHYQPQVDLATDRIIGVEALLRWDHPRLGAVPPDHFIPVAEQCGLIDEIGQWVLNTACQQTAAWHTAGLPLRVAVNLSPRQFHSGRLIDAVATALEASGLAPQWLELELTEGLLLQHEGSAQLEPLKQMGVRLVIDDFGTGYASFAYLRRFAIDGIKSDRSFIQAIDSDSGSAAITRALLSIAEAMGLDLTADGVEEHSQLERLRRWGCPVVQGYLFSRPVLAAEIPAMARSVGPVAADR